MIDLSTVQSRTPTTGEDALRMPDDGNRYELIGGRLYLTPAAVTSAFRSGCGRP